MKLITPHYCCWEAQQCRRLCLPGAKALGRVRLHQYQPREGFKPQECWEHTKCPKQHPGSKAVATSTEAPSSLHSKDVGGEKKMYPQNEPHHVPCVHPHAALHGDWGAGSVRALTASSSRNLKQLARLHTCIYMGFVLPFPAGETQ